jgi:hypothetical protein
MAKELIKCPKCGEEFELSQAISRDIEEAVSKKYAQKLKEQEEKAKKAADAYEAEIEKKIKAEQAKFGEREKELTAKMEAAKKELEKKAKAQAAEDMKLEFSDMKAELEEKNKKLEETRQNELALRKKQRELEEKEAAMELDMARKIDEEKAKILEESFQKYEDQHRLKDAEKDKKLEDMKKQIDDLKRKAEQASQQSQGEVLELEIENILKEEFPFDEIEEVSKGVKGGDIIQHVRSQSGRGCGKILWETKRTKTWSDSWLQKLKDDQRDAKADISVIVSEVLPKGMSQFRMIDGVWVTSISSALSLALALRVVITQVSREKQLQSGKKEKMELVYAYLTGPEFRNRVEAIVESFVAMKQDLDKERRAMNKIWDKRGKQIERVVLNIGGMQGDVEGLAGMSLPKIETLELSDGVDEEEDER